MMAEDQKPPAGAMLEGSEIAVRVEEVGSSGCKLTAFCPFCRAQIFGYSYSVLQDELCDHFNLMHPGDWKGEA